MKKSTVFQTVSALGLAMCVTACSTQYETKTLTNFVDRSTIEAQKDHEITSKIADVETMNKDKQLNIKIVMEVIDETPSHSRVQGAKAQHLKDDAMTLARNYLGRIKAYNVVMLPKNADKEMASEVQFQFVINMRIVFGAEMEQRYSHDETMYKTSIVWELIDNRGSVPKLVESNTCKNVTSRKTAIKGLTGKRMGGSDYQNMINAYRNTLENALIEFRAQLANRVPFGGRVISMRLIDNKVRMNINAGADKGVENRMQMLILTEDGDRVCVGEVTGGAKGNQATLEVYRWLSDDLEEEYTQLAKNRTKAIQMLKEEGSRLYAISLGMPTPSKDERTQIEDFK